MSVNNNRNALEPLADSLVEGTNLLATTLIQVGTNVGFLAIKASYEIIKLIADVGKIGYQVSTGTYDYEMATTNENDTKLINASLDRKIQDMKTDAVEVEYLDLKDFDELSINLELIPYKKIKPKDLSVCVGYDMNGNKVYFDITRGHTLIGGVTQWGKSNFLNVFITSLITNFSEKEVAIMGCDITNSDIGWYQRYKHFRGKLSTSKNEFYKDMEKLEKEIDRRTKLLNDNNCRNIAKFNKISKVKTSYIIYIIDELPLLVDNQEAREKLKLIMGKSAKYGIYFVLSTQDATKESIGKCKMNCSQTLGFYAKDETDSNSIIGYKYLKDIKNKGRCFYNNTSEIIETQIFLLQEEEIDNLLEPYLKEKYKTN